MRYLILVNNYPSMDHLPARATREEAERECARLNALIAERNAKLASTPSTGARGEAFLSRADDRVFTVREIE